MNYNKLGLVTSWLIACCNAAIYKEEKKMMREGKVERFSSIVYLFCGDMLKTTSDVGGNGAMQEPLPPVQIPSPFSYSLSLI